ncbi:MAG TPA: hypothetical protein VLM79_12415 [Kofleriaceae bacterium]|nr:hypothetical protein [Kofleriaceae bacterium]
MTQAKRGCPRTTLSARGAMGVRAMRVALTVMALAGPAAAETGGGALPPDGLPPDPPSVPTARPVIPIEDTRTHGPTARNWLDLSATPMLLVGRSGSLFQLTSQLAVGLPTASRHELREIYDAYHLADYQLRVRSDLFGGSGAATGGPMTVALQRYFPISPLAISPLLYAHFGLEAALSTPWLSGRFLSPHPTIQVLDGVDTELASDGWSLRPASVYFRGDFLACRSLSGELGLEPEAFVPASTANEYGTRFHVALGWSWGCHGNMSPRAPKIAFEYRGRVTMYAGAQSPSYRDSLGVALQVDLDWFVAQLFYRSDPGRALAHDAAFGLRLQIGRGRSGE